MRGVITGWATVLLLAASGAWAQSPSRPGDVQQPAGTVPSEAAQLRQQVEQMRNTLTALEQRLATLEQQAEKQKPKTEELEATVSDLDKRVSRNELHGALDRLSFSGDYRFEGHSIWGTVPSHFDGMRLQNLVVKTLFFVNTQGGMLPTSVAQVEQNVATHYGDYEYFTQNLTFKQLQEAMSQFPPALQQQLFGLLQPSTFVPAYDANTGFLATNRLRLRFNARVSDNMSFEGRLSMYKVFGDSTGVQVFNGQPNSLNMDGTSTGVPNSDMLRVERAFFNWNRIGGSKFYLSVGRRPSTSGPPVNFRDDQLRGGTPSAALIDFQFDGVTFGYVFSDKMIWRLCYGIGYESGFGNGNLIKLPQDRLKDVHFLGANLDLWNTERTFIQATYAHAWNVTDGFNGLVVLPNNPLTGDPIPAPVVLRFTPSANLGAIHLFGVNVIQKVGSMDLFVSGNFDSTRPNGQTGPFGGLLSDPFAKPEDHTGSMIYVGARYNLPADDGRTKIGFEFNHGSKYWFNFAQAQDDIIAPKTNTRGEVYETYLTHRIHDRFMFKVGYIRYQYRYSGSGWDVGAPKALESSPILGFPTYDRASMLSFGLTTDF